MVGKYNSWLSFISAYIYRQIIRWRIHRLVIWPRDAPLRDGCTAIIGMCSRLPDVLLGNLKLLAQAKWPDLKDVIVVVDAAEGSLPPHIEMDAHKVFSGVRVRFFYYPEKHYQLVEKINLPYIYSWLSWSIGISLCETRYVLLHDYDALILDKDIFALRYNNFVASGVSVQGISWYQSNGLRKENCLATTFEAFIDVRWLRCFKPIKMFNQIAYNEGRSKDYDTLLYIQHRHTPREKRSIDPMPEKTLVHPSQMIHQYTMFRRFPEMAQPCASLLMIPFFEWFSGKKNSLCVAVKRLQGRQDEFVELFADGRRLNLSQLTIAAVDWNLKQMLRVCVNQQIRPFGDLYNYGESLYRLCGAESELVWRGDFTPAQREWIEMARVESSTDYTAAENKPAAT